MKKYLDAIKKAHESGLGGFAVRALQDDEQYNIGDYCRESYEWDGEYDCSTYHTTGETAGGTCAVKIIDNAVNYYRWDVDDQDALAQAIAYAIDHSGAYGTEQVLIAGDGDCAADYGVDDRYEARIINARVVAIID